MDRAIRTKIVLDRLNYEKDPDGFVAQQEEAQEALRQKLVDAMQRLPSVQMSRDLQVRPLFFKL